jgi:hypothetical protein
MQSLIRILLVTAFILCFNNSQAQGGGPPMLTDDPGTVNYHQWEINTSVNSSITNNVQLAVPYIDANYGVTSNLQLKAEAPYLLTFDHPHTSGNLGDMILGIKYQFMSEDKKHFLSAGIYPQETVTGDQKGLLFPVLLEKTICKWMIGEDIGYFFSNRNNTSIINGNLVGYIVSDKLQVMGEYFLQHYFHPSGTAGFMNYGFRYTLNKTFTLMGSFGTQVVTQPYEQKQYFISFLGVQSDF